MLKPGLTYADESSAVEPESEDRHHEKSKETKERKEAELAFKAFEGGIGTSVRVNKISKAHRRWLRHKRTITLL